MTRLSNRQYPLLRAFIDERPGYHMSIEKAQEYDQRPFRSMLIRKWLGYKEGKGFYLTAAGYDAWSEFISTNIFRADPSKPLTSYFDPKIYRLHTIRKRVA